MLVRIQINDVNNDSKVTDRMNILRVIFFFMDTIRSLIERCERCSTRYEKRSSEGNAKNAYLSPTVIYMSSRKTYT